MKLVHFGAGGIGRSFIGQLFSRAGWEIVFVDIDKNIVNELNRRGRYTVKIRDKKKESIVVKNVRGVQAQDSKKVRDEITEADLLSTAVGKTAVPSIVKTIAEGIIKRRELNPLKPIDIIICENMINAASFFRKSLASYLPENFPIDEFIGLVETSISKMVPIMSSRERKKDPLLVYAEAYNTLIVDERGFKGNFPRIPGIEAKQNMKAWVDKKLYIHNLGHAVLSYTSFVFFPHYKYVWEAVSDSKLHRITKEAMWEAGRALLAEYPDEFRSSDIEKDIDDLLLRFGNRVLGDTLYRAGKDLYRKLGSDDRLIGAIKLCLKHLVSVDNICLGIACALFFKAVDENGNMFEQDLMFHKKEVSRGVDHVLSHVCNIKDKDVVDNVKRYYSELTKEERDIDEIMQSGHSSKKYTGN
ncbi:MAG: mannitol-1-phosphate 5-dehydrogenase [Spirochaetota bacterium]|nr:MAG: mannitol-1-phosphate 5-dehydrogenase [Spirochaetota bacterium]